MFNCPGAERVYFFNDHDAGGLVVEPIVAELQAVGRVLM